MFSRETGSQLPGSIPLYTRRGREITNEQVLDIGAAQVERLRKLLQKKYGLVALERRPPTGVYNCHGLTFANRRTAIHDPAQVDLILVDDAYRRIKLSDGQPGDIVVYYDAREITHTGIILRVVEGVPEGMGLRSPEIVSKWGTAGEYVHRATEGPYREYDWAVWTDRP